MFNRSFNLFSKFFFKLLCLVFLGLVWEFICKTWQFSSLILPTPIEVFNFLLQALQSGMIHRHIAQTLFEVICGLCLGGGVGFCLGLILGEFPKLKFLIMPYVVASQVVPKLALTPLFILWFGFGTFPVVVMTALICFFPLLENTLTAMEHVDTLKLQLFRMLGASDYQTLIWLKIPHSAPLILAGVRVALVLSWVGAVVAEFMGSSVGLGALIVAGQGSMNTAMIFASLILITLMGWIMYAIVLGIERRALIHYPRGV
jgi:NitT/TauT family transport system permease protein